MTLVFLGYTHNGDSTTTLNYKIINNCADRVEYASIETGYWTRFDPPNGGTYAGQLGDYAVRWIEKESGVPTQGIRFDGDIDEFKDGAADAFTFTVRDFTRYSPNTLTTADHDWSPFGVMAQPVTR